MLNVNDIETLSATVMPEDAEDKTITFSTSDSAVVTVDNSGNLSAIAEGTATITATTSNNLTATCEVTVAE